MNLREWCYPSIYNLTRKVGCRVSIDWLGEYESKFKGNNMIANLKDMGFHGKVIINFCNGSANTSHVEWCVRPYTGTSALLASSGVETSTIKNGGGE